VVVENRHKDLIALCARAARLVHLDGVAKESVWSMLTSELDRQRWSRTVPQGELERAFQGALEKYRNGEWTSTAPSASPVLERTPLFTSIGELLTRTIKPNWLVRQLLERNTLACVFGLSGHGKTFTVADIALCVATGRDYYGHDVMRAPVLILAGEGYAGLTRRAKAWGLHHGIDLTDTQLHISRAGVALTDEKAVAELLAEVTSFIERQGHPALVVVDTLARNFGGGDENSTKDMGAFVRALDTLRAMTGACVLVVHHTSKANPDAARGNGALRGAMDWEYAVVKEAGAVTLTCTKAKDFEPPGPLAFRITGGIDLGEVDDDGEPVTGAVLTRAMAMPKTSKGKAGRGKNQLTVMRLLHEMLAERSAVLSKSGRDPDMASVPRSEWRARAIDTNDIRGNRFDEVVTSLRRSGQIDINDNQVTIGSGKEFGIEM
jgi:hypothetical protein